MRMPWAGIGRWTVWLLAYSLVYAAMRIAELAMRDDGLRGLYRMVVQAAIGVGLAYLIFRRGAS